MQNRTRIVPNSAALVRARVMKGLTKVELSYQTVAQSFLLMISGAKVARLKCFGLSTRLLVWESDTSFRDE